MGQREEYEKYNDYLTAFKHHETYFLKLFFIYFKWMISAYIHLFHSSIIIGRNFLTLMIPSIIY